MRVLKNSSSLNPFGASENSQSLRNKELKLTNLLSVGQTVRARGKSFFCQTRKGCLLVLLVAKFMIASVNLNHSTLDIAEHMSGQFDSD